MFCTQSTINVVLQLYDAEDVDKEVIMVRGPVASGKSTWAVQLTTQNWHAILMPIPSGDPKEKNVFFKKSLVACANMADEAIRAAVEEVDPVLQLTENLIIAVKEEPSVMECRIALQRLGEQKLLLVFDEGHLLFGTEPELQTELFKVSPFFDVAYLARNLTCRTMCRTSMWISSSYPLLVMRLAWMVNVALRQVNFP